MRIKTNKNNSLSLIFFSLCLVLVFGFIFAFIGGLNKGGTETAEQNTLITFNVDDTEYRTPKNWVWAQFVNSVYSDDFAIDEDDYICSQNGLVAYNNDIVLKNNKIIANADYIIIPILNFSIDETVCQFEDNMTWADWVNSRYNNDVTIIDNFVYTQNGVISYNNSNVLKTDLIIENTEYDIVSTISFGLAIPTTDNENDVDGYIMPCRAENSMTWAQWLASDYNYLDVESVNGYACIDNCYIHTLAYTSFIATADLIINGQTYSGVSSIISFSIDNTSYNAVNNMTWAIWLNSPYNTNNYTALGNYITYNNSLVVNNNNYVEKTDSIIANTSYTLENTISFNIGNTSYQTNGLVVQKTWQSWVNSAYNTDNYTIVGDYIYSAQNGVVSYNGNNVLKTDYIVANRNYTLTQTISFTVFGNSYNAINGMTWAQFVNSDFNTKPFIVNGNTIKNSSNGSSVIFNDTGSIAPTDVIVANYSYDIGVPVGDGLATDIISVGGQSYRVRRGATWSQWLENGYGVVTNDFTIDSNNYIHTQNGIVRYNNSNVVKTDVLVRGATYSILYDSYTITYKDGGNTAFSGTHENGYPLSHTYGTATTLKTATKTGYTFGGWYTDSACTNATNGTLGATTYTANITLYAKWTINTISFTIDNVSYTATYNMTWAQWVVSAYNTASFTIDSNNNVSCSGGLVSYNNTSVVNTDTIIANASYTIVSQTPIQLSTFHVNISGISHSYYYVEGMTWGDWIASQYNTDGFYLGDESFFGGYYIMYNGHTVYYDDGEDWEEQRDDLSIYSFIYYV